MSNWQTGGVVQFDQEQEQGQCHDQGQGQGQGQDQDYDQDYIEDQDQDQDKNWLKHGIKTSSNLSFYIKLYGAASVVKEAFSANYTPFQNQPLW